MSDEPTDQAPRFGDTAFAETAPRDPGALTIADLVRVLEASGVVVPDNVAAVVPRAIPTTGRVPDVLPGDLIESAWGNALRDRSIPNYGTDVAAMKADTLSTYARIQFGGGSGPVIATRSGTAWVADIRGSTTQTTDSFGSIQLTAATMGVTSINDAIGSVLWSTSDGTPQLCAGRIVGANAQFRVWKVTGSTLAIAVSTSVTVYYRMTVVA